MIAFDEHMLAQFSAANRSYQELSAFLTESNRIEGITDEPTGDQIAEAMAFLNQTVLTVPLLERLAKIFAGAELRRRPGMNVRVGNHRPMSGGPQVEEQLECLCDEINEGRLSAHGAHILFELLHPFMDANGRVGRLIWLWIHNGTAPLGFLHTFYYETLEARSCP